MLVHLLGRLDDVGMDGTELISEIANIFKVKGIKTRNYFCKY